MDTLLYCWFNVGVSISTIYLNMVHCLPQQLRYWSWYIIVFPNFVILKAMLNRELRSANVFILYCKSQHGYYKLPYYVINNNIHTIICSIMQSNSYSWHYSSHLTSFVCDVVFYEKNVIFVMRKCKWWCFMPHLCTLSWAKLSQPVYEICDDRYVRQT